MSSRQGGAGCGKREFGPVDDEQSCSEGFVGSRSGEKRSKLREDEGKRGIAGKSQIERDTPIEVERHRTATSQTSQGCLNIEQVEPTVGETSTQMQSSLTLPHRLFVSDRIPQKGRINSYSKPEYLLDIVEVLKGSAEFHWLQQSCFGRLFNLPMRKCSMSGKLIHQFLCRSLVTRKKHEMWFVFGGYPIRFSLREFALLTGLNCKPYPRLDEIRMMQRPEDGKDYYWYELIGKEEDYTVGDLVDMLKRDKELPATQRMSGDRRLKLALVVLVEGVLTCETSTFRPTKKVVEMLKDVELFAAYPWGRKSFVRTVEMVKVGSKNASPDELGEKLNQASTVIHGFTLAIQLLILAAVPLLGSILPDLPESLTVANYGRAQMPKIRDLVPSGRYSYRPPDRFEYQRLLEVSQNERTGDCGPLTAKFIELHSQGISLTGMTDKTVDHMRMKFAVDVYEEFAVAL